MSVLSMTEVLKRIQNENRIFVEGSYDSRNFWQAKYDLRVGQDLMVIPDVDFPDGRRYGPGETRADAFILNPGQIAFVSTAERLCMPWDLVGNIGPKFGIARQGLLVLTGFLVDPGFGLEPDGHGGWKPKIDERLHFLIANLSQEPRSLTPGYSRIASIQFLHIDGEVTPEEITSTTDIFHEFFDEERPLRLGLGYFLELNRARSRVDTLENVASSEFARIETEVRQEVDKLSVKVGSVEGGTQSVIYFGVFLFMVTLLATAVAAVLELISNDALVIHTASWPTAVLVVGLAFAIAWLLRHGIDVYARLRSSSQ
jgi:deoxycytidine triphosphate deaminase